MHDIAFFTSPFDLSRREFFAVQQGQSIRDALIAHNVLSRMDENAVLVACNGIELLESQWDRVVGDADIITLHLLPQGPAVFAWVVANWITVAYIAVTALYLATMQEPEIPGVANIPEASPSYSISARGNAARLGSPKPVFYGKVRTWPDLSSLPYTEFEADSDQVLYQLYEVRQGACTINVSDMRIEDTPLADFADYQVEVIQPGEKSVLFPTQIVASNEFSSITFSSGAVHYSSEVTGAYVACDIGQRATRLAVDIIAPMGLYGIRKKNGSLSEAFAIFFIEAQKIDDANNALGDYFRLTGSSSQESPFEFTEQWRASSRDAIRRTFSFSVPLGRYRVRVGVISTDSFGNHDDYEYGSCDLVWVGLRATLEDSLPATTTTRVALKIRASEQLGSKSLGRFNCVSTGQLAAWHPSTGWAAPSVTANPAWVFADVIRNAIYGGARDDAFIDLPGLYALAQQLDVEGIRFDGGFDTATTVWDALTRVAAVAQAVPVDRAGVYYMVRDVHAAPSYMFTHANIVRDSFKISYASVLEETADSVRVNFFDESSDYRTNSLLCKLTGSAGQSPRDITLFGCTNKNRAYKWGMYLSAINHYRRISVEFDTGIEGYLPFFYDTVAVSHYLIGRDSLAQVSGDVVAFDGVNILTLSEKIAGLVAPYIVVRGLDGSPSSPYPVTILGDYRVQIVGGFDASCLVFDAGYERPHFMCGEGTQFYAHVKVNKISAQGNGVYRISGFVDAPEVYAASNGLPTPPVNVLPALVNRAPLVKNLTSALSGFADAPLVTLSWSGSYADYYQVDFSVDAGTTWLPLGEGKFLSTNAEHSASGIVHYRVAGVSILRGEFATLIVNASASQFITPVPVSNVHLASPFVGAYANILWESGYTKHVVKIKKSGTVIFEVDVDGTAFEVSAETAAKYNLGRSFDVEVFSVGANGLLSATAGTLSLSNPSPAAVSGITTVAGYSQIHLEWSASADTDLGGYQVWMSATSGFTPAQNNVIYDGADNKIIIRTLNGGAAIVAGTPYYLRVAAYDKFGKTGLNISSEFSATPLRVADGILEGEIRTSQLHHDLTSRIDLIDKPVDGLVAKTAVNAQGLISEAQARASALAAEAQTRATEIFNESQARISAILAESNERSTAIYNQQSALETLEESISQSMALLTAGSNNQFDHAKIWYFDSGTEGWTGNGTPTIGTVGFLRPANHATDPFINSPVFALDCAKYPQVRLRIRRVGVPAWEGNFFYVTTASATWGVDKMVTIPAPKFDQDISLITINVAGLWAASNVTQLRFDLSGNQDANNYFEIDWVAIGRPSPGASSAELFSEQLTRATADGALSGRIDVANAAIAGKASSGAVELLNSRVSEINGVAGRTLESIAAKTIALEALVGTAESGAFENLEAKVNDSETGVIASSNKIVQLKNSMPGGGNLIPGDTDFSKDLGGWNLGYNDSNGTPTLLHNTNSHVQPPDAKTLEIHNPYATYGACSAGIVVPVTPGIRYCFSAYLSAYRCHAQLLIQWFNSSGGWFATSSGSSTITNNNAKSYLSNYFRDSLFAVAPAGAFSARINVFCSADTSYGTDPYLFFGHPSFNEVTADTTVIPPYTPSSVGWYKNTSDAIETLTTSVNNKDSAQSTKYLNLRAQLEIKSLVANPYFIGWANGLPTGWNQWHTVAPTQVASGVQFTMGNGQQGGISFPIPFADYKNIDVELSFTITSGELYGAGIALAWVGGYEVVSKLTDYYAGAYLVLNKKVSLTLRLKRPANVPSNLTAPALHLMGGYSTLGALAAKTIIFHSCVVTASDKSAEAIDILDTQVNNTETGLVAQSNKILRLNSKIGGAESETFEAFQSRVTSPVQGNVAALSTQVTLLSAAVDGAVLSNLWPHDSECMSLGFYAGWGWTCAGNFNPNGPWEHNKSGVSRPADTGILALATNAGSTLLCVALYTGTGGYGIPVIEGKYYTFRFRYAMAMPQSYVNVHYTYLDAGGNTLTQGTVAGGGYYAGGTNINNWGDCVTASISAPAGAVYLQWRVSFKSDVAVSAGWVAVTKFQVTKSDAAPSTPAAYKPNQQGSLAAISSQLAAQATANSSTAGRIDLFKSAVLRSTPQGDAADFAAIQQKFEVSDGVSAQWGVKAQIGDLVGGIGLYNEGGKVRLGIAADQVAFFSPGNGSNADTAVSLLVWDAATNRLVLNELVARMVRAEDIVAGTITTDKLVVGAVTNSNSQTVSGNPLTISSGVGSKSIYGASLTKAISGSSVRGEATCYFQFTTISGLTAGWYTVNTYVNNGLVDASNSPIHNFQNVDSNGSHIMWLTPSTFYSLAAVFMVGYGANSLSTGTVKISLGCAIRVRNHITGAEVGGVASGSIGAITFIQEFKV